MRVLVVDDEKPARDRLVRMLGAFGDVEVVGQAQNGLEALSAIEKLRPDLVFLDIEMPVLSGLEVAESLGDESPAIVFATAYDKFALEAFDVAAIDYLVKPIARERLRAAIEKAQRRVPSPEPDLRSVLHSFRHEGSRLAVRLGADFEILNPRDISAVLAQEHYAVIISGTSEHLSEESLELLETRLAPHGFMRVHRSAIINLNYVVKLNRQGDRKYVAVLNDVPKTEAPISRDRLRELKTRLNID